MKKGLHVADGYNINLDNVCVWIVGKNSIQLQTTGAVDFCLIDIYVGGSLDSELHGGHAVTINEFKRIGREINEYMQV